jgi:D-alanyl-D-alanine carboxypeptidase (penicillin-binding protein 5/6)
MLRNLLVVVSAFWGAGIFLSTGVSSVTAADLKETIPPLIEAHQGKVAVVIRHLGTGEQFVWRENEVQPAASLIKLPVMVAAYRMADQSKLDLTKLITLKDEDKVPGSGILSGHFSAGLTLSLRDAVRLMIRYSDNTATNLVVDQIGLPTTADTMESLGFPETRLNSKVYRGDTSIVPERSRIYGLGSTTALETVNLLEQLHEGTIASRESCAAMIEHLLACDDKQMLVRELPSGTKVAHKTGAVNESRCSAGIVYGPENSFAICVLTTDNKDRSWKDDNAAQVLIGEIARAAFDHFNPEWQRNTPPESGDLKIGAIGTRVELLQRTLNARMIPSAGLGVDGDFGPATEAVVRQFQETHALPVTGIVDAAFWDTLGPVVEEAIVADPDVINGETLAKQPMEPLDGAPFVTSDAWIIVDAADGRTVDAFEAETARDIASTTKIMTAWLVLQLAEKEPSVLEEALVMSSRGDETIGSTADLRAGESVSVREALYGLLLPSGNDMSVALAEHFGQRFAPADATADAAEKDPLVLFVAAMNAEANRLGMKKTHYCNPHGLTEPDHLSTVTDLAILARVAVSHSLFPTYMTTRQRGAVLTGPGGYKRNVLWKNTNELLQTEGYNGLKTGTTDKAGACLVSAGERDGRCLIVVVLGSAASESRYTDSRNLYRWGWKQVFSKQ